MKRTWKMAALLLAGVMALAGCSKGNGAKEDTSLADIKAKGELILGLDDAFPPMGFRDENNEIVGFDIDVANEVAKRIGVKLTLQPIEWDSNVQELNTGNVDCLWNGMSYSKSRDEEMELTKSYMKNKQLVVVLTDSPVENLADLDGKTVVAQNGSTAVEAIDGNPDFKNSLKELVQVSDNVQAMMDLKVSGSDAVVMDEVVARYYMDKNPGQYRVLNETLAEEEYMVGFRKGAVSLREEVEKQFEAMKQDGTMKELSEKWFDEDLTEME